MGDNAEWNEEYSRIVCELFAKQVSIGNRPSTHLNTVGYDFVIAKFVEKTGLQYKKQQFKNKWDKLKNDYNIWKKLTTKETGLGWDSEKKTIKATAERWKQWKKEYKGCAKFQKTGLQNEDLLCVMFEDIRNTCEDHWSPAMGTFPSTPVATTPIGAIDGQPGAMHDTEVLYHALHVDKHIFPHPPQGKYYLVDAGYPNRPGYLAPYKGERYHIPDFQRGDAPNGEKEKFNRLHSSCRNVIERTIGVWKMKWRILLKMPSYPMWKQMMIVAATMALHNFIRDHASGDEHFTRCDRTRITYPQYHQDMQDMLFLKVRPIRQQLNQVIYPWIGFAMTLRGPLLTVDNFFS